MEEGFEVLVLVKIFGEFLFCFLRYGICKKVGNYFKIYIKIRLRDGCCCVIILVLLNFLDNFFKSNVEVVNLMRLKIDILRLIKLFYYLWLLVNLWCKFYSVN